ncbi:hypothetical protein HH213_22210 [Duganella dendranthematis]|jgi:hypothetical protein|uniref:Uncharacterized protein n=1 Tax=Duganella dendranthematis TaxID=2728021 RepID=A0ABX6MEC7_9BURK|nr:hypothetical protein [Duganella dendranthematis]QJD92566.1 hypothetical protein HH213_22210 [Duganella dendranthematis]
MDWLTSVSPILIPIVALMIPIVGIIAGAVLKVQKLQLLHETIRVLSANGQPIPQQLLDQIIDKK